MIDWLNPNEGAALAILNAVLSMATIILAWVTVRATGIAQRSLQAAESFERERSRPYVTVSLLNVPLGTIQLRVENVGANAAYQISINTIPEILILEGWRGALPPTESERRHPFIERGIAFLPPHAREQNVISLFYERFKAHYPDRRFVGSVTYRDKGGFIYQDPIVLDLSINDGLNFRAEYEVGDELHKIRELLEKDRPRANEKNQAASGVYSGPNTRLRG